MVISYIYLYIYIYVYGYQNYNMQLDFNNNFFFTRTAPQKLKITNRATKEKNNKIKKSAKSAE